jgi:hypothetical protein
MKKQIFFILMMNLISYWSFAGGYSSHSTIPGPLTIDGVGTDIIYSPAQKKFNRVVETVIENFQSGHGYTKGAKGTQTDDTTDYIRGSQSLKLTGTDETSYYVAKTGYSAIDFTGKNLVLYYKISSATGITAAGGYCRFYIGNDAGTDAYYWTLLNYKLDTAMQSTQDGVWQRLVLSFSEASTVGTPTRNSITAFQLQVDDNDLKASIWLNGICSVPEPTAGVCSITFDDGNSSQYTAARTIMDAYSFPATAYIIPDAVGTNGYMTLTQIHNLQKYSTCQILTQLEVFYFSIHS